MPFTSAQFFDVFRQYNQSVWPAQLLLNALALVAIGLATRDSVRAGRFASLIIAALWMWMGVVYHLVFFVKINPAAVAFGAIFIVESALLCWWGVVKGTIRFRPRRNVNGVVGALLITYALVLYPAVGFMLGRRYPETPTFGLPCPTTIFTFGLLLWSGGQLPLRLIVIPAAWAIIGFAAARSLSVTEDYGLLIAGILATTLLMLAKRPSGDPEAVRPGHERSNERNGNSSEDELSSRTHALISSRIPE